MNNCGYSNMQAGFNKNMCTAFSLFKSTPIVLLFFDKFWHSAKTKTPLNDDFKGF